MVQSPSWEANWFADSQDITRISRNPKVHYRTHKHPSPVSILGQPNPVHIPTSHLLEIHPNIIHPSTPRLRILHQILQRVTFKSSQYHSRTGDTAILLPYTYWYAQHASSSSCMHTREQWIRCRRQRYEHAPTTKQTMQVLVSLRCPIQ